MSVCFAGCVWGVGVGGEMVYRSCMLQFRIGRGKDAQPYMTGLHTCFSRCTAPIVCAGRIEAHALPPAVVQPDICWLCGWDVLHSLRQACFHLHGV